MFSIFRQPLNPKNSILQELTKTYGISRFKAIQLLKSYGIHKDSTVGNVSNEILSSLCKKVETSFLADIDLKKNYMSNTHRQSTYKTHHALFLRILLKKDNVT